MKKVISSVSLNSSVFVRKIFSRTSLRSNPSSDKCHILLTTDDIEKLNNENQNLRKTISMLKDKLDRKDATIGHLAREKEIMYIDLRKYRRTIRNIQQELEDERIMNSREKEYLREEINAMKMRIERRGIKEEIERMIQIEKENDSLKCETEENTETIYNLCIKYLRLKSNKDAMKLRLEKLNAAQDQALADVMITLDSNREQLKDIISEKMNNFDVSAMNQKYFTLIDKNNRLQYENAANKIKLRTLCNYLGKHGDIFSESGENLRKQVFPRSRRTRLKDGAKSEKYTKCKNEKKYDVESQSTTIESRNNQNVDKIKVPDENGKGDAELNDSTTPHSGVYSNYRFEQKKYHRKYSKNDTHIDTKKHSGNREKSKLHSNEMLYLNTKFNRTSDSQLNDN